LTRNLAECLVLRTKRIFTSIEGWMVRSKDT
jgi:hypothetical protein